MKKYSFVLSNGDSKLSGHAHTLVGVRHIFKKVTSARVCDVYKKCRNTYDIRPSITYRK